MLSLRDVERKEEAKCLRFAKIGLASGKTAVLKINDKIRTNVLVSLVISGTEMESRDFSHPVAMYCKCSHFVVFE